MNLLFKINIIQDSNGNFIGTVEKIKGLVAHGNSLEEVGKKLSKLLFVKMKIDYGFPQMEEEYNPHFKKTGNVINQVINVNIQQPSDSTMLVS